MKIKSLTVHGFKSFPERTTFAFPSGISAIVGPNGCGKSNIVDAIRWVIGEHNIRHLRGKGLEDLIFNGSETRKPMGMAEVSIVLTNEDGRLPALYRNFSEIEVKRRVYRSGESEFFINKVPARLKDVVELFSDTGIGRRTYSIIEQGQVGWLVTAKPEERRAVLEEAAGINRFKLKKDQALRRLQSTMENLSRLDDVIAEVKRQLNSLNRQAKKAERYRLLRDELRGLELKLSRKDYEALKLSIDRVANTLKDTSDRALSLKTAISSKESSLQTLQIEHMKKESALSGLRGRLHETERSIDRKERSIELSRLRIEELERTITRLERDIEGLDEKSTALKEDIEALKEELSAQQRLLEEKKELIEEYEQGLNTLKDELNAREATINRLITEALRVSTEVSEIKHSIQNSIKEEDTIRLKIAQLEREKEDLTSALEEKRPAFDAIKERLKAIDTQKGGLGEELKELTHRLSTLKTQRAEKEERLSLLKEELSSKRARLKTLEEMETGIEEGIKALIEEKRGKGVHGTVADIIEVSPGYERAVEASLGERLRYVIVDSHQQVIEGINYLKTRSAGKTGFIPVRELHSVTTAEPPAPEGTNPLKEKIRVSERYRPIVDRLFDDVFIVDDLHRAIDIWRSNGAARRLVTPEGETIEPRGIVTGGYSNGEGVLLRKREIKELGTSIATLTESIKLAEDELKRLEEEIAQTDSSIEGLKKREHSAELEKVNTEGEFRRHREEIERLEQRLKGIEEELPVLKGRLEELGSKKEALLKEREELERRLDSIEEEKRQATSGSEGIKEEVSRQNALLTEAKVSYSALKERYDNLLARLKEKESQLEEAAHLKTRRKEEIEHTKEEIEHKTVELNELTESLDTLLKERDRLKEELKVVEEEFEAATQNIRAVEEELRHTRKATEELEEERRKKELELKELELNASHMRETLIERWGVDIAEYTPEEPLEEDSTEECRQRIEELREKLSRMGEVGVGILEEYQELEKRYNFLMEQREDIVRSVEKLRAAISRINRVTRERLSETFEEINRRFGTVFQRLFNGGKAELRLTGDDLLESGIDIIASPPGKKLQNINLFSGGEKALTAVALIFSIFLIKPSPFSVLDEVDAPLDDVNVERFNMFLKELSKDNQFIVITHNKRTMEMADSLFGITMEEAGVSKLVTVEL